MTSGLCCLSTSDGTLITQRFHFVQNKHPYRHVLGWYRLAQELEESGVTAIVLFDGKERSHAKAREVRLKALFYAPFCNVLLHTRPNVDVKYAK